jgi:outer membrane lipoprotein-sorting protein
VAISPDGKVLATAAAEAKEQGFQLCFWDATTGKLLRTADQPKPVHGMPVIVPIRMEFSPDGKTLVTTAIDIRLWDVATGRCQARLASVIGGAVSFSPDGKRVAVGSVAASIEGVGFYTTVTDTSTAGHVTSLGVVAQRTPAGWFLPGGRLVAAQGLPDDLKPSGAFVQLYEVGTWKATKRLDGWFAAAGPDGNVVLTLAPDKGRSGRVLEAWDATTGAELRRLPHDWVPWEYTVQPDGLLVGVSVGFSPDGTRLAIVEARGGTPDKPRMGVRLIPTAGLWAPPGSGAPAVAPAPRPRGDGDPADEGETLLREMDAKIVAAKTLRIDFEVRLPPGFLDLSGRGTPERAIAGVLVLGDRNRFRFEGWAAGDSGTLGIVVSDGKRTGQLAPGMTAPELCPVAGWHNEVLREWLGRGGTFAALSMVWSRAHDPAQERPGPGDGPRAANPRLLQDEVVNGVRCRVVGYDLSSRDGSFADARVWIDPNTHLPVRREMTFRGSAQPCTAVHTRFEIDPKLDDALFEMPTEADLLLARMDAKIRTAKALRVEFEVRDASAGKGDPVAKGSLVLADRNRFRHEVASFILLPAKWVTVSDGKRIGGVPPHMNAPPFPPLPEWHNEVLRAWLGRGGTFLSPAAVLEYAGRAGGKKPGPDDDPRVTGAKLLPDEEVGGVKARVVAYDLSWRLLGPDPEDRAMKVRLWIDPKTGLPVRRTMTARKQGREVTYTEALTTFEVDPKIDDKLFEVPE